MINMKAVLSQDDCLMHPIYGFPENFQDSQSMPTSTFRQIFHGFLFLIDPMYLQNLKFVAFTRS